MVDGIMTQRRLNGRLTSFSDKLRVTPEEEVEGEEAVSPSAKRTKKPPHANEDPFSAITHPEFSNIPAHWQQLITFGIERALTKSILGAINTVLRGDTHPVRHGRSC